MLKALRNFRQNNDFFLHYLVNSENFNLEITMNFRDNDEKKKSLFPLYLFPFYFLHGVLGNNFQKGANLYIFFCYVVI